MGKMVLLDQIEHGECVHGLAGNENLAAIKDLEVRTGERPTN